MSTPDPEDALAQARVAHGQGRHSRVVELLEVLLHRAQAQVPAGQTQEVHALLSHAYFGLARLEDAVHHGRLAAAASREQGDREAECQVHLVVAYAFTEAGAHDLAMTEARTAFDIAEAASLGLHSLKLMVLIARLHERMGDFVGGEAMLLQTLSRARDLSRRDVVALATNALLALMVEAWGAQMRQGQPAIASQTAERLQLWMSRFSAIEKDQQDAMRQAVLRSNLGAACGICGRDAEAERLLRSSLEVSDAQGFELVAARAVLRLARLKLGQGDLDAADELARQLDERLGRTPHPEAIEEAHELRADLAGAQLDEQSAAHHAQAAALSRSERQQRVQAWRESFGLERDLDELPRRMGTIVTRAGPRPT